MSMSAATLTSFGSPVDLGVTRERGSAESPAEGTSSGVRIGALEVVRDVSDPPPPLLRQAAGCSTVSNYEEGDVRVTTAFNRMLGLPGAWVRDVAFGSEAVIVTVVLRAEKPVCSGCGARGLGVKEHRTKRWRALDLGACRCVVECRLRRLYCPGCGDVYEAVPWARAGAKYTREFDDLAAWLGAADEPDAGHEVAADRLEVGRQHPRARRRGQARPGPLGRAGVDRLRRGLIRRRAQVPDLRRRSPPGPDRVGGAGPQRQDVAGVLRRAHRRAALLDQGRLDRHVRRV